MSARDRLRLVSHYPGRLRVRADVFHERPEIGEEVARVIGEEPGVTSANATALTGSLLVIYDPRVLQLPKLVQTLIRLGGLHGIAVDEADAWRDRPDQGDNVRAAFAAVNGALLGGSRGAIDMRTLFPAALAGTGVALFLSGRRRAPEWYDLLNWALMTFWNMNPRDGGTERSRGEDGPRTDRSA